jgi:hypothetical protein
METFDRLVNDNNCLICNKPLDFVDKVFKLIGEGNYYSFPLDSVKIDGWICPECANHYIVKDGRDVQAG